MIAKAVLHLHDVASVDRLAIAAEQLESGLGFVFHNTWFLRESGRLWCIVIHEGGGGPVESFARERFQHARVTLTDVRSASAAIDRIVERLPCSFALVEDYGQGVAPLCCLVGDDFITGDAAWRVWRAS